MGQSARPSGDASTATVGRSRTEIVAAIGERMSEGSHGSSPSSSWLAIWPSLLGGWPVATSSLAAVDHRELVPAADVVDGRLADAELLGDLARRQAFLAGLDHPGRVGVFETLHVPMVGAVDGFEPGPRKAWRRRRRLRGPSQDAPRIGRLGPARSRSGASGE